MTMELDRAGLEPRDLHEDFPDLPCDGDYCGAAYWRWEDQVAKPAIEAAGYTDVFFYDIERDSFGPLIRGVSAKSPNGEAVRWDYG